MSADLTDIQALRAAGQYEEARQQLLLLAEQFPEHAVVQYEVACVHDALGLEREAVPFYQAAIRAGLEGDNLRGAYLGLGSTFRALGRYEEAAATLDEGLRHFPEANELRVFQAMANYNLERYHEAIATLLHVILDTSADPAVQSYARALRFYAADLDQTWGADNA